MKEFHMNQFNFAGKTQEQEKKILFQTGPQYLQDYENTGNMLNHNKGKQQRSQRKTKIVQLDKVD